MAGEGQVITVDAPTRGINAYDSPEDMDRADAIALDNWICRSGYLEARPSFTPWKGSGATDGFDKVTVYHATDGDQLLAFKDSGEVYDISTDGALGSALDSGFSTTPEDICTFHINDLLIIVSGDAAEQSFDGTSGTALDYTGSSPAITPGEFTFGCNFKGRAMYINEEDCSFWYAAAGSYQGDLTEFPLSSISEYGGVPKHIATWTMDTGTGPDDTFVIYMTTGEVLLYQGDDPGDVDNWEIIGRFMASPPTTKHASVKVGSDLILLAESGYINLADVIRTDQKSDFPKYSMRVSSMLDELVRNYRSQGFTFTNANCAVTWNGLVIFNWYMEKTSPASSRNYQFVLNVSTGAWSRWTGIGGQDSMSWVEYASELYTGGAYVFTGKDRGGAVQAEAITFSAIPAFSNFGMPEAKKQLTAVQFDTTFSDPSKIEVTGYSDFNFEGSLPTPTMPTRADHAAITTLGTFPFVRLAMLQTTKRGWQNLHAQGFVVSFAMQMKAEEFRPIYWRSTSIRFRRAGTQ